MVLAPRQTNKPVQLSLDLGYLQLMLHMVSKKVTGEVESPQRQVHLSYKTMARDAHLLEDFKRMGSHLEPLLLIQV